MKSGGSEPSYLSPTPQSQSLLDAAIDVTPGNRLEYLRGKQKSISRLMQVGMLGVVGLLFLHNIDKITQLFDQIVSLEIEVAYGAGCAVLLWIMWRIVGWKVLQDAVTGQIDRMIYRLAKWMRTRGDKFLEAEFNIDQLRKRKNEADVARGNMYAVYQSASTAAADSYKRALEAGTNAKGLQEELLRRRAGGPVRVGNTKVSQSTTPQLEADFERSRSSLRVNYTFYQRQTVRKERLGKKCAMLQEASRATALEVESMTEGLHLAKQDYDLAVQENAAVGAYDDIMNSPARRNYDEAIDGILVDTSRINGHVQMLMDRLDPTIQNYRMNETTGAIADEAFFSKWLQESNLPVDPNVQRQLTSPTEEPQIPEIESLLGNTPKPQPVAVRAGRQASQGAPDSDDFDDLLKH